MEPGGIPMKHEWRKAEKTIYLPKESPTTVSIPNYKYLVIKGVGDPNQADFQHRVEILFSLSYGIKMAPRKGIAIEGYFDYTVYPLEGIWDYSAQAKQSGVFTKDQLIYTLMIRQPAFVTQKLIDTVITLKKFADYDSLYDQVEMIEQADGNCVQMMHIGSFDDEPASFEKMQTYVTQHGLLREDLRHREIYLSDFRTTEAVKLQTVLRIFLQSAKK